MHSEIVLPAGLMKDQPQTVEIKLQYVCFCQTHALPTMLISLSIFLCRDRFVLLFIEML